MASFEEGVSIPKALLDDVLLRTGDLAELKAVLLVSMVAAESRQIGVFLSDLQGRDSLRKVVAQGSPVPAKQRLKEALDRAVANGVLFRLVLRDDRDVMQDYFVPASNQSREMLKEMFAGADLAAGTNVAADAEITVQRPNIFSFYEQHLGPLTPLIAEQLREAEGSYPRGWLEEAMLTAVRYNKRNWHYVEAILQRWEESGVPDGVSGGHP
ncbi:MAG: DnaD domain-containing protein [Chloroflexota bacterium]